MGIIVNNIKPYHIMYNGVEATLYHNGVKIWPEGSVDPYNPLNLPPNIVRVRTNDGNPPKKGYYATYETATLVEGTVDVYDVYKSGTNLYRLLSYSNNVVEVLGANTTGITHMDNMFGDCSSLTNVALFDTSNVTNMTQMFVNCKVLSSVPLFDTSNVTDMTLMFYGCSSLTSVPLFNTSNVTEMGGMFEQCKVLSSVPLFDTSNVTNMDEMFYNCISLTSVPLFNTPNVTNMRLMFYNCSNVQSGALALYQQASTQTNPPSIHDGTFKGCGSNTTTGAAELAQIPSDWK